MLKTLPAVAIILLNCRRDVALPPAQLSLNEATAIRDWLLANLTPNAAKRCLTQIKACCNWAAEEGLIEANPFGSMKIKLPKGSSEEQDINPFTKTERDLIINTFLGVVALPPAQRSLLFILHIVCQISFLYWMQTITKQQDSNGNTSIVKRSNSENLQ